MQKHIQVSRLPQHAENVLELEEPEHYSCRIWKYTLGHSIMTIVFNRDDAKEYAPIYAVFEDVEYFEGVMWWKGANLKTTSKDEYFKLLMKIQRIPENLVLEIPGNLGINLFTFVADNVQVKILASSIFLTDDISSLL